LGAQGYFLGRGTQQISSDVIRKVGMDNIWVLATPTKLKRTEVLRVDTGDAELDEAFRGYRKALIGYDQYRMVKVA